MNPTDAVGGPFIPNLLPTPAAPPLIPPTQSVVPSYPTYSPPLRSSSNPTDAVGGPFIPNLPPRFTQMENSRYSHPMFLTPYTHLTWAYQLHYHVCFRTHHRHPFLSTRKQLLAETLNSVCALHDFHRLSLKVRPSDVQLVLSLKPNHQISTVLKKLKGESSRVICKELSLSPPLWARGYLARSTGRATARAVKAYVERQAEHHGYNDRWRPPVFRFRATVPKMLSVAHACFDLKHHLVLATRFRRGVFDSKLGQELVDYWLKVAAKRGFALDQASVLPDHVHLIVRITPKMSIEECALLLMNNGQYFIGTRYPERLIEAKIDQLWQASAYAGTCGELSTALLKSFLEDED
jgi:putative transposase